MQLGGILIKNLKQCWDISSKLRLLNVFHGITQRELVQVRSLRRYKEDFKTFLTVTVTLHSKLSQIMRFILPTRCYW